jgi:hypothetical protein
MKGKAVMNQHLGSCRHAALYSDQAGLKSICLLAVSFVSTATLLGGNGCSRSSVCQVVVKYPDKGLEPYVGG